MTWDLAIDFGTSYTAGAVGTDGRVEPVEIGNQRAIPSSVFATGSGQILVGNPADNQAALDPDRYERTPKRRLGQAQVILGKRAIPTSSLVGAVLREVAVEAIRRHGSSPPGDVVLTHPARWAGPRQEKLRQAAEAAGLVEGGERLAPDGALHLVPEPVAAAVFYSQSRDVPQGDYLAVYDLGGGTFDVAVLRRAGAGFELAGEPGGIDPLGGEDFDHRLLQHIGNEYVGPARPQAWSQLQNPPDMQWRRWSQDLRRNVRETKEYLSGQPSWSMYVPGADLDVEVTREEFERLIRVDLSRTVEELVLAVERAGLQPSDLSAVYLVGGSSRIPLVATLVWDALGVRPFTFDDPKLVVAKGAALLAPRQSAAPPPPPPPPPPPRREEPTPPLTTGQKIGSVMSNVFPPPSNPPAREQPARHNPGRAQYPPPPAGYGGGVSFTAKPPAGRTPLTVVFNASLSADFGGPLQSWQLDFGDGETTAGSGFLPLNLAAHIYSVPGSYQATLTVTRTDGEPVVRSATIRAGTPGGGSPNGRPWTVAGMVCGLIAILFLPIIFGPLGIIFGFMGQKRGDDPWGRYVGIGSIATMLIGFGLGIAAVS
jgi:molecular chaperone DnaK